MAMKARFEHVSIVVLLNVVGAILSLSLEKKVEDHEVTYFVNEIKTALHSIISVSTHPLPR